MSITCLMKVVSLLSQIPPPWPWLDWSSSCRQPKHILIRISKRGIIDAHGGERYPEVMQGLSFPVAWKCGWLSACLSKHMQTNQVLLLFQALQTQMLTGRGGHDDLQHFRKKNSGLRTWVTAAWQRVKALCSWFNLLSVSDSHGHDLHLEILDYQQMTAAYGNTVSC